MNHFIFEDLKIRFFDNQRSASTCIIFLHGNSQSHNSFRFQLQAPQLSDYRLVALDLPGHGESKSPCSYSMDLFVRVLQGLITHLKLTSYILVGHSLGGHLALHSLKKLSPRGVFVFGTPPLTYPVDFSAFRAHPDLGGLFKNEVSRKEVHKLLSAMYASYQINSEDEEEFFRADFHFRESFSQSVGEGETLDECELLRSYSGHSLVICSEKDELINSDYIQSVVTTDKIQKKQWCHSHHIDNPVEFNECLLGFIRKTLKEDQLNEQRKFTENLPSLAGRQAHGGDDSKRASARA